jgi:predicted dehydrogenase
LSGGGAMIDHVVHVTDLLRRLLKADPTEVFAQIGSNMHGKDSDDTAMLTISFPGGIFASLDSSWSRPDNYKTWGDVTIRAVGEKGVLEADLFASGLEQYSSSGGFGLMSVGANLDQVMVEEFLSAINENREPATTIDDGIMASRTAIAAYESVKTGQPVKV